MNSRNGNSAANAAKARMEKVGGYGAIVRRDVLLPEVLVYAKKAESDRNTMRELASADSSIAWSPELQAWINSSTKQPLPPSSAQTTCANAGDDAGKCQEFFGACLDASSGAEADAAAAKCIQFISKVGPDFFTKMNADVHKMHPEAAVNFLQSIGFRGRRVNFMDALEPVENWAKNLSVLMSCDPSSKDVSNILCNIKLMEYIRAVWAHVHSNPEILNKRSEFVGHHNTDKDECCETKGFDIRKKANVPGNRVTVNRLLYKIKRDNRLRFAMLGIPTGLLHVNVLSGMHGGSLELLNDMKPYNFQTGSSVLSEFLKMTPTAARKLSDMVELTVKSINRHKMSEEQKNNVREAHQDIMKKLTELDDSERKVRRLTVAWSVLADKVALSGTDVIPDDLKNNLMKVYSATQRYVLKADSRFNALQGDVEKLEEVKDNLKEEVAKQVVNELVDNVASQSNTDNVKTDNTSSGTVTGTKQ